MVLETEPLALAEWFPGALLYWVQVMGLVALAALLFAFFVALLRNGPARALEVMVEGIGAAIGDVLRISPRRVLALARLAIKEALHRRVLVAFAVFVVVLLFAGWFLDRSSTDPARLYLSFVLTSASYLVLLLALFLSVFSLPADLANRTIYTIVTKPVRPSELVLGRMLGFSAVGTAMLLLTAVVSYFFVIRGLDHRHDVVNERVTPISEEDGGGYRGRTETENQHRHQFILDADGVGRTETELGHWHDVQKVGDRYEIGPPQGMLVARVPIYGKLTFRDRTGAPVDRGVNVGEEWTYRSYIDGGTLAAALWNFQGVKPEAFPNGLPIELTIRVFRTHKGDIEKGVLGSLVLRNPKTGLTSAPRNFVSKEFSTDTHTIPLQLTDSQGNAIDLFRDLVAGGELQVQLQCLDPGQYFGMAQPDVYIRARDASFSRNFVKGYIGIWLQMLVLTAAGVMFSTFLNGAVAMLATLATLIAGFFIPFMQELASGRMLGGGPVEALYRIVTRMNVTVPLPEGLQTNVIQMIDEVFAFVLGRMLTVLPNFGALSDVNYVAYGFDVPFDLLATHALTTLAYLVPVFIAGYLFFRSREVAR
jgi:hypothetical protein